MASLLTVAACGFNLQTNHPYTPSQGVNADIGGYNGVKIRNLMILSRKTGQGFLSGTLYSGQPDALTSVSGNAIKSDGSDGGQLTTNLSTPVILGNGSVTVLTDRAPIRVLGADLQAGLTARLTLQFRTAGSATLIVPVVDANQPEYATVRPQASPTP
jgi:hypothetical protein